VRVTLQGDACAGRIDMIGVATLDELERTFRADPALADLLAALDRSAASVSKSGRAVIATPVV